MAPQDEPTLPVVVTMRVKCERCGHSEDETYEFDLPVGESHPIEESTPGTCPVCRARILVHLRRTTGLQ
jgi:DNA-directed RNA polymerase subunit RPC12/RpoP